MIGSHLLFLTIVFLAVFGLTILVFRLLVPTAVYERMSVLFGTRAPAPASGPTVWVTRITRLGGILTRLSVPTGGWQDSPIQVRFMNAGLRSARAPVVFYAAKTLLTFLLPLIALLVITLSNATIPSRVVGAMVIVAATIGYFLPNAVLSRLIETRQQAIFEHFPDALDLITTCIEAGLALDAAIDKVATESVEKCPPLAEELHLVTLELRAGSSRDRALRNLALRAGTEDIGLLVAMLIQAERFGTSIAQSLKVHADVLRSKRQQNAEERAAKVATKLLFPLMFCIFPAMLLVLMGPAMLNIYHALLPTLTAP
jgi:tight adherence protein C